MCTSAQVEAVIEMISVSDPEVPASTWDLLRRTLDEGMMSIDKRLEQYGPHDPECFSLKDANQRLAKRKVLRMRFRVEVICLDDKGADDVCKVLEMDRHELAVETLGLNRAEAKAILGNLQNFITARRS